MRQLLERTLRTPRTLFRLARTGLHLAYGISVLVLVFPRCGSDMQAWLRQRWARQLLSILGLTLSVRGSPLASMRVANHVSWIDIFLIMASSPAVFVSKEDVKDWPLIGLLAAGAGTIFMQRGSRRAALAVSTLLAQKLAQHHDIVAFPEGTTTDGSVVLPFHGALLQGAIQAGQAIQPMTIRYLDRHGKVTTIPAYCGETSLTESMWCIADASGVRAELRYLAPHSVAGVDRKELAEQLRRDVIEALQLTVGRPGQVPLDSDRSLAASGYAGLAT
jgi:1-acyl-sn-glycerol-3-phosphate acyltransferase